MRTSSIQDPERNHFLMIREWQVRLCDGDYCAAALISFFRYVHDWKLEQGQQAMAANNSQDWRIGAFNQRHQELLGEVAHCRSMLAMHVKQGNAVYIPIFKQQLLVAEHALAAFNAGGETVEAVESVTEVMGKDLNAAAPVKRLADIRAILNSHGLRLNTKAGEGESINCVPIMQPSSHTTNHQDRRLC